MGDGLGVDVTADGIADSASAADSEPDSAEDGAAVDAGPVEVSADTSAELPPADVDPGGFAYLVIDPPALDFGQLSIGAVETLDVQLENAGDKGLTITSIGWIDGTTGAFAHNLSQVFLGPGQTKILKVTFYVAEGIFSDALRFESNAVNGFHVDLPVLGEGVVPICEDADGDGHGINCAAGADCNESDAAVYWGAPELCNGLDDDCDGLHDEDFIGLGSSCEVGFGACVTAGYKVCGDDDASLKCSVNPVTGGDELCNDQDDDCDGATDEDFPSKGKLCTVGMGACAVSDKFICNSDGTALVCNVTPIEPGEEICGDGIDNDCDGILDEGELEICGDGIDNDCDGETDESGGAWGEVFFARNYYNDTVSIYKSNGDGTFQDPAPIDFPGDDIFRVHAVGDFDGDRYYDLVVIRIETAGETICNTSADCPSGFRCAGVCRKLCSTSVAGDCPVGQVCIDTNNNVAADDTFCRPPLAVMMAVSSCEGSNIELTELFTLAPDERLGPVVDADGNGHLDFVGMDDWATGIGFIWMNDGAGNFTKNSPVFNFSSLLTWSWGLVFSSKDMTGDGVVDLLGRRFTSGGSPPTQFYLFEGLGDGTFDTPFQISETAPYPANLITMDDFDSDGDQDILAGLDDDGQPGNAWMLLSRDAPDGNSWVDAYPIFDVAPTYNSGGDHPGFGVGGSFDYNNDDQPDVLAAWIPEECGSYLWGCSQINDPANICYGGDCRKVGIMLNNTRDPCLPGTSCIDGQCLPGCTPDCSSKQCGTDGCGGSCGVCAGGQVCGNGACLVDCVPDCTDKVCGDNGCGGICGACAQGDSCLVGACVSGCIPSCAGKACGDDGCGGSCAVFKPVDIVEFSDNRQTNVKSPTNVPPTSPMLTVEPTGAPTNVDLTCTITQESYDVDSVTYRYRWYRDGEFVKELGEKPVVPPSLTAEGEQWECRVRATDGIEWSPEVVAYATIGAAVSETP